ncbi:hypothetical protein B0H15DRAFT_408992 [Mycena belliarum]|uniref:Nephrocystin 3-like N-terminal domain-containing protein n=1 Tax=Mycena belliarum TaxID=1033014 RepID=A0AAD6UFE9_9AGAR|nr:hypothetical protein B0H15DRAFT_408992 [Mycena belliae]
MAKVNQSLPGRGFYYVCLRAERLTLFERRLLGAPFPQEIPLEPMFSIQPEMHLRLCLLRRPFYIWPTKTVVKSSSLTALEAHEILRAGPPEGVEHTFLSTPEITVRLQYENSRAILDESTQRIARRTHILKCLGRTRKVVESIAHIFVSASEMDPIAKSVCQGLGRIYEALVKLEEWDDELLELIEDMSRCLAYVEDIRCFHGLEHFRDMLQTLERIICQTGNLVLKYPAHGLSFQAEMSEYETLRRRFQRWTRQFSERMGVESLKRLGNIQEIVEGYQQSLNKHRYDVLDHIRPHGIDRDRPIPGCLKGTRETVFAQVDAWLADSNSPSVLWIKGFPGSGKTCISSSLAEKWAGSTTFGASFFFERDGGVFTAPSTMLRSLAHELCRHSAFMDALVDELETGRIDFSTVPVPRQAFRLMEIPLQHFLDNGDMLVIIVDALDECGGLRPSRLHDRRAILAALARWSSLSPHLRLIVTSRDEVEISEVLGPISKPLDLRLTGRDAARDIELFLKSEFERIAYAYCLPAWPTQDDLRLVAQKARGLFVWAATLVKFVDQPGPQEVLEQILRGNLNVEGDITDLYTLILEISFLPHSRQPSAAFLLEFNDFVGSIVASAFRLEKGSPLFGILGVGNSTADYICIRLRSVMMEGGKHLRFSHQSFVDFLMSESCPPNFRIIPTVNRQRMACAVLSVLNEQLDFDLCRVRTSFTSNSKNPNTSRLSRELSFACQVWGNTLVGSTKGDEDMLRSLKAFFEHKFLFWLEVLSLLGKLSCAVEQLEAARTWVGVDLIVLGVFVKDAIEFMEIFDACIKKSAPHIYLSAMTFIPQTSMIYQMYWPLVQPCASVAVQTPEELREGRSAIPAPIVYSHSGAEDAGLFEGHTADIEAVLLTSDERLVSASYDGTIRFWDPFSGRPILEPFTHGKYVTSLAASTDGSLLLSGSRDGTAAAWDMEHHRRVAVFPHDDSVTSVALSPTNAMVVTGCKDKTVRFWDLQSQRKTRPTFRSHASKITGLVFLDEDIVISSSLDGCVYLHHLSGHSENLIHGNIRIHSFAIAQTPRSLVAGSDTGIVVWDLDDQNIAGAAVYLAENSDRVESVTVKDSRLAAAVGNRIEIWDLSTRRRALGYLIGHKDTVTSVAFSEDGGRLVSGSLDRRIRVWDVATEAGQPIGGFPDGSTMETTGWIRGPKRDLIIWVPESHRRRLCWGRSLAVIDGRPKTSLKVSESVLGRRWYKCFKA